MKQANFDVSHELDEFLMVEKPLTHTKRKVNPDLDKMKPELRQLEEQWVLKGLRIWCILTHLLRFTHYDFSRSQRMSYYPHNQPVVALGTGTASTDHTVVQSATDTIIPTATIVERSQAGSPTLDSVPGQHMRQFSSHGFPGSWSSLSLF